MKSSKEKQDRRKAELQAAAERDGFETWSQALTAWSKGEACLTKRAPDEAKCPHCGEPLAAAALHEFCYPPASPRG